MEDYYRRRAAEYEEVYRRDEPPRTRELELLGEGMKRALAGREVLEVACGTGYWTQVLSEAASGITGVDAVEEVLAIARTKQYGCPVRLVKGDAYALRLPVEWRFDGGMANFWLSHVPRERVAGFLEEFNARLDGGSQVFMADNVFVPGVGGERVERPGDANTYKLRELKDGSKHKVLKNYFSAEELKALVEGAGCALDRGGIHYGAFYWSLAYRT